MDIHSHGSSTGHVRNLEKTVELFHILVDRVTDYAIFALDPDGYIITWNRGAELLKGYRAEEIVGQHIQRFYPTPEINRPSQLLRHAREQGRVKDEGWRVRKDGTLFWAEVIITALYDEDGTLRGYAKVTRDLTERRQAEQALRQLNEELEKRVCERTAELHLRLEELEQFHDVVVGRELKMVQLENEAQQLRSEIERLKMIG